MAAQTIRDALKKAKKIIQPKIDEALSEEVFKEVKEQELKSIDEIVYSLQTSGFYHRRYEYDGIGSDQNIVIDGGRATDGKLSVANITEPNPYLNGTSRDRATTDKNLVHLIEYGRPHTGDHGYDYWKHPRARPFLRHTREQLKKSGAHINGLKRGLKRLRINVV